MQGAHQVAKKSTTVILPGVGVSAMVPLPSRDWIARGGASLPTSAGSDPPAPGRWAGLAGPPQADVIASMKEKPRTARARSERKKRDAMAMHPLPAGIMPTLPSMRGARSGERGSQLARYRHPLAVASTLGLSARSTCRSASVIETTPAVSVAAFCATAASAKQPNVAAIREPTIAVPQNLASNR